MASREEVWRIISGARKSMAVESLRRWVLIFGVLVAAVFATWTDLRPDYVVSALSRHEAEQMLTGVVPPEHLTAEGVLISEATRKNAKGPVLVLVSSPVWEVPLSSLFASRKPGDVILLMSDAGADRQIVKVSFSEVQGLGWLGRSGAAEALSYPLRHLCYLPLSIMLLVYILLPVAEFGEDVCAYNRRQVIFGDFASCLFYGIFIAAPMFMVGGIVQALTVWIGFTAFFWAMAGFGLCALWWNNFYAVFRIHVLSDQLIIVCPQGIRVISYMNMRTLEQVRLVPPKWLFIPSCLAALSVKDSFRVGQSRRASLLEGSAEGFCIGTEEADALYIWLNNSLGYSLTHFDLLVNRLKASGAKKLSEFREFEAIFPPIFERYIDRKTSRVIKPEAQIETALEKSSRTMQEPSDFSDAK